MQYSQLVLPTPAPLHVMPVVFSTHRHTNHQCDDAILFSHQTTPLPTEPRPQACLVVLPPGTWHQPIPQIIPPVFIDRNLPGLKGLIIGLLSIVVT